MTDALQASADRFWNWFTNVPVKHRAEAPAVAGLMEAHNFGVQHTGGGCLAFEHTVDADWYLWLTDRDCGLPVDVNESAYFGAYHVDGWHLCLEETTTAVAVTVMQTVTNVAQHLFGASAEESIRTMRDVLALASREGLVATFEADAVAAVLMAVPVAPSVLSPLDALAEEYSVYLEQEGLPSMCALELLHEDVTDAQRAWLSRFVERYEQAEEAQSKAARTRVDELAADLEDEAMQGGTRNRSAAMDTLFVIIRDTTVYGLPQTRVVEYPIVADMVLAPGNVWQPGPLAPDGGQGSQNSIEQMIACAIMEGPWSSGHIEADPDEDLPEVWWCVLNTAALPYDTHPGHPEAEKLMFHQFPTYPRT